MRDIQYADKLSKMIAIETISHSGVKEPEKFYPFHRLLEELFPNIHKHGEKYDFDGSLMFKIKGSGDKKPLMLMSHMDVVSAEGSWTQPPFSGYNDGERIWGRGTLDTKGSLFALMQGVEELLEEGKTFPYDIYLVSTCTEEVGGEGARAIVEYLSKNKINIGLLVDEGGAVMDDPIPMAKGRFAIDRKSVV